MDRVGYSMKPIGFFSSVFGQKTGCPRQFGLLNSRGRLRIDFGNNVNNAVESLEDFSHIYIIFVFHLNFHIQKKEISDDGNHLDVSRFDRMKATPPRLNKSVGVFSCRSPYRPNPIGLSIGKIVRIVKEKNFVDIFVEGVDMIDGTPVLDIKPYLSKYDSIPASQTRVPEWIKKSNFLKTIQVSWTEQSVLNLKKLMNTLEYYEENEYEQVRSLINNMIQLEPRSAYRIEKNEKVFECFCFYLDNLNIRCVYLDNIQKQKNNSDDDDDDGSDCIVSSTTMCYIIDVEDRKITEEMKREELKNRNVRDAQYFVENVLEKQK